MTSDNADLDVVLNSRVAQSSVLQLAGKPVAVCRHCSQFRSETVRRRLQLQFTSGKPLGVGRQLGNGSAQLTGLRRQLCVLQSHLLQLPAHFDVVALLRHQLQHIKPRRQLLSAMLNSIPSQL